MKLAIPLTPPPLDDALAFVDQLQHRLESDDGLPMTDAQWEQAVTAAASKRDRDGLATLLRVQLVPALGRAMLGLARIVAQIMADERRPDDNTGGDELVQRIETAQQDVMSAGQATYAAELRTALLLDRAGPSRDRPDSLERMQAKLTEYLQMRLEEVDVLEAIADDLGLALRQLTGPARAAIEAVEAGELDDLLAHPLQQQLFATFHARLASP